jgi:hypothetical protein
MVGEISRGERVRSWQAESCALRVNDTSVLHSASTIFDDSVRISKMKGLPSGGQQARTTVCG